MSFAKSKKVFHEENKYLPPPGYYEPHGSFQKNNTNNFNRGERFNSKLDNLNPGPGSYFNGDKQGIKKRLLEQANRREPVKGFGSSSKQENDIKISSIPSIPKKSATRVYEQLAPGILILHEEQYENSSIGPGSYDVNQSLIRKKVMGPKIQPQPRRRIAVIQQEPEVKVPTIAQELRQEKRLLYKQNIYRSSNVNKNDINSSDLCLQTIILRQKLLRGDEIPPPGYYYNQDVHSTFKNNQFEKPAELQVLGGKEERFKQSEKQLVGPGAYTVKEETSKKGGFIAKNTKIDVDVIKKMFDPGPGAYELKSLKVAKQEPKGNYPPIFGSGCKRFASAPKTIMETPGPGSYKVDKRRNKKVKYIKIRKDFYDSQPVVKQEPDLSNPLGLVKKSNQQYANNVAQTRGQKQKNTFYFNSKVERFLSQKSELATGPGAYELNKSGFVKETFNRTNEGYVGDKSQRFDDVLVRPNIGPGTYY